jgi:hypothetical protein
LFLAIQYKNIEAILLLLKQGAKTDGFESGISSLVPMLAQFKSEEINELLANKNKA